MEAQEVLARLRKLCEEAGGQAAWAKKNGISQAHVSDILKGSKKPARKILTAMGLERAETTYREIPK